jgi:hypothetical protein
MSDLAVALDACVLHDLQEGEDEEVFTKLSAISIMRDRRVQLAVDHTHHIIGEYFRVLQANSLGRRFVTSCIRQSLIIYVSGRLRDEQVKALTEQGFDPSDMPYLAVAQATSKLYVTSEEKHLRSTRREFLFEVCSVRVATLLELAEFLQE